MQAIDSLPLAIFLLDGRGFIIHGNEAGRALIEAQDCVVCSKGLLMPVERQFWPVLYGAFAACAGGGASGDGMNVALVLTGRSGARYVAQILALTSGAHREAAVQAAAVAAVFIRKASPRPVSQPREPRNDGYGKHQRRFDDPDIDRRGVV